MDPKNDTTIKVGQGPEHIDEKGESVDVFI